MALEDLFRSTAVAPGRLRQEIFALGDRHQGDALKGARRELDEPGLTRERRALLLAVVAHFDGGGTGGEGAAPAAIRNPTSLTDMAYLGVIAAAVVWTVMTVQSLLP
jgi:hypothetical protein